MSLDFVVSEKRKRKLLLDGSLFYKDKQFGEKIYWKCEGFQTIKCKARVITVVSLVSLGDASHVEAERVMEAVRERASKTQETPTCIVSSSSIGVSGAAAAKLPSVENINCRIRYVRKKEGAALAIPISRRDIVLPEQYRMTDGDKEFLLFDSGPSEDRILIFSTKKNLSILRSSKHWFSDGTFKTVPSIFQQLYTIHGSEGSDVIPLVYALLTDKKEETYTILLSKIKEFEPAADPTSFLTDFETAVISAVKKAFPSTNHRGCFFHFCRCIWRRVQKSGLKQVYENDVEFSLKLRMLAALAFVPTAEVVNAFENLCESDLLPEEARSVIDYFEDTWIGRPDRRMRRRPPVYSHQVWNCYESVINGLSKTNNSLEGWHRGFQHQIDGSHPSIWKFITAIKKEQSLNELRLEQYTSGKEPPRQRKKYRESADG